MEYSVYKHTIQTVKKAHRSSQKSTLTKLIGLLATKSMNMRKWYAMFKQICYLQTVITKQNSMEHEGGICHDQTDMSPTFCNYNTKSMEFEKVMHHVQTDISLTICDYKTKSMKHEKVMCHLNRHVTYHLWLQNKRALNMRKWCTMFN
jgi:hypothetical protein